jgi:hypothetical protein
MPKILEKMIAIKQIIWVDRDISFVDCVLRDRITCGTCANTNMKPEI